MSESNPGLVSHHNNGLLQYESPVSSCDGSRNSGHAERLLGLCRAPPGTAECQTCWSVKAARQHRLQFTRAAAPRGWLGPAFSGGRWTDTRREPLGQAAMESLRVPDLGPPVPTAGQITGQIAGQIAGLDVDLRCLVC